VAARPARRTPKNKNLGLRHNAAFLQVLARLRRISFVLFVVESLRRSALTATAEFTAKHTKGTKGTKLPRRSAPFLFFVCFVTFVSFVVES